MRAKLLVIITLLLGFLISVVLGKIYSIYKNSNSSCPETIILPGIVKSIGKNDVYISQVTQENLQSGINIKPEEKVFKGVITDKTKIVQRPILIQYLIKEPVYVTPEKMNLEDLKAGFMVTMAYKPNFCNISNSDFQISQLEIYQSFNSVTGEITELGDGWFIMYGNFSKELKPVGYKIYVSDRTEISSIKNGKPQQFSFSDLQISTKVTVYTNTDIRMKQKLEAYRIEPEI